VQHVRAILQILASLQANPLQSLVCESVKAKKKKNPNKVNFLEYSSFWQKSGQVYVHYGLQMALNLRARSNQRGSA